MSLVVVKHLEVRVPDFRILDHASIRAHPGEIQALMGPSGSGKTTLLSFIGGYKIHAQVKGLLLVNGQQCSREWLAANIAMVEQSDSVLPTATVRETLTFAARLKLPRDLTAEDIDKKVMEVIKELGMSHRADCYNGGNRYVRGLSGGERRRVSIGEQLVKDPQILLLDEPTSGLDSKNCNHLIKLLKTLAAKKRTVVFSIHQPSSRIARMFDRICLMANGRITFNGTLEQTKAFFAANGYKCPNEYNPADYYLDVISDVKTAERLSIAYTDIHQLLEEKQEMLKDKIISVDRLVVVRPVATRWMQIKYLTLRKTRQWLRDPFMIKAEFLQYTAAATFIGFIFFQEDLNAEHGSLARKSVFGLFLTIIAFVPAFTVIIKFDEDRQMIRREKAANMYLFSSYYFAITITSWIVAIVLSTLASFILYYMVGLRTDIYDKFWKFVVVIWLFALVSESLGVVCAFSTHDIASGLLTHTPIAVFMFFLGGFFSSEKNPQTSWTEYFNPMYYGSVALTQNEFLGTTFELPQEFGTPPLTGNLTHSPTVGTILVPGEDVIGEALQNGLNYNQNVLCLFGIMMGVRIIGYFILVLNFSENYDDEELLTPDQEKALREEYLKEVNEREKRANMVSARASQSQLLKSGALNSHDFTKALELRPQELIKNTRSFELKGERRVDVLLESKTSGLLRIQSIKAKILRFGRRGSVSKMTTRTSVSTSMSKSKNIFVINEDGTWGEANGDDAKHFQKHKQVSSAEFLMGRVGTVQLKSLLKEKKPHLKTQNSAPNVIRNSQRQSGGNSPRNPVNRNIQDSEDEGLMLRTSGLKTSAPELRLQLSPFGTPIRNERTFSNRSHRGASVSTREEVKTKKDKIESEKLKTDKTEMKDERKGGNVDSEGNV